MFVYDLMNRLKQVTNANSEVTKFDYDFKGNLTKVTDSRNQVTEFVYDANDRVVKRTDPLGKSEFFEYDLEGNLLSHTDKKGRVIQYEYNAANELVKMILPDGKETEMSYDLAGNIKTIEDDFTKITYTYDALNRVKTTSTNGSPYQPGVTLTNTYTKGNRTKLATPFGDVDWVYDLQNRVKSITSFSGNLTNYSYDSNGRRSQVQYPNGIVTKLSYDESSRLEKIAHQRNNVDVVSYSYKHDSNGNRTQMNVTSPITEALSQVNYTYDQVNQLIGATKTTQSSQDETFTYDNLGNRLKKNNQSTNNVYDNNNRIVEDDKFTYAHDDNGNMTKKVNKQTGYTHKYVWDFENKLQFVTEHTTENAQASKTHTFIYDALGRRILKDSNGVTRKYIYDYEDIVLEFNNNDQLQAKFTHGPGIDEPVEMNRNNTVYFYHADGLGSITALTDVNGNTVQSYAYSSFGETKVYNANGIETNSANMIQNPYAYTSREWDYETGKYQYRARDYDPRTGRFLSPDPIGFLGQDSNLYRYVFNNVTKWIDPMGLSPQDVYDMVARFNKMMQQMNDAGVRMSPGELNNLMASLNSVSFGTIGKDYLGCGEQANFVAQNLEGLKFEDKWTFVIKNEYFVDGQFHHQWIEAVSNNPSDPVLKIDPWNSTFTPK